MLEAGCDECGMGCIAGCVCAAGVVIEPGIVEGVRDSKLVSEPAREEIASLVRAKAAFYTVRTASVETINNKGLRKAWENCVSSCVIEINRRYPEIEILVDGERLPRHLPQLHPGRVRAVVNGDATVYSIGAASIVAKAYRDRQMIELARSFPNYHWEKNKGYPTALHVAAIREHGMTEHHRVKPTRKVLGHEPAVEELPTDPVAAKGMLAEILLIAETVDVGDWVRNFATSVGWQIDEGRPPTPRQMFFIRDALRSARKRARRA